MQTIRYWVLSILLCPDLWISRKTWYAKKEKFLIKKYTGAFCFFTKYYTWCWFLISKLAKWVKANKRENLFDIFLMRQILLPQLFHRSFFSKTLTEQFWASFFNDVLKKSSFSLNGCWGNFFDCAKLFCVVVLMHLCQHAIQCISCR